MFMDIPRFWWSLTVSVNLKLGYSLSIFTDILSYLSDTTLRQFWNSHIIISATLSKYTEHAQNYFARYLGPWAWELDQKMFKSPNLKALVTTMSRIIIRGILLLKRHKNWIRYHWTVWKQSDTLSKFVNTVSNVDTTASWLAHIQWVLSPSIKTKVPYSPA